MFEDIFENMCKDEQSPNRVNIALTAFLNAVKEQSNEELLEEVQALRCQVKAQKEHIQLLKEDIKTLSEKNEMLEDSIEESEVSDIILRGITSRSTSDSRTFAHLIDYIFTPTFEKVKWDPDVPLWLYLVTKYYNDRLFVIHLIRYFNIEKLPSNIADFKLPVDWSEYEIDLWLDHMSQNVVCNNGYYDWGNIRWWRVNALIPLKDVYTKHKGEYSETPFQYVFMNPHLKTETRIKRLAHYVVFYHSNLLEGVTQMNLEGDLLTLFIDTLYEALLEKQQSPLHPNGVKVDVEIISFLHKHKKGIRHDIFWDLLFDKYINAHSEVKDILDYPVRYFIKWLNKYPRCLSKVLESEVIDNQTKKMLCEELVKTYEAKLEEDK